MVQPYHKCLELTDEEVVRALSNMNLVLHDCVGGELTGAAVLLRPLENNGD